MCARTHRAVIEPSPDGKAEISETKTEMRVSYEKKLQYTVTPDGRSADTVGVEGIPLFAVQSFMRWCVVCSIYPGELRSKRFPSEFKKIYPVPRFFDSQIRRFDRK